MQKSINFGNKIQWRVSPPQHENDPYIGICDRLELVAIGHGINDLIESMRINMQDFFLKLYYAEPNGTKFFKHAWEHSIEYKVEEGTTLSYVRRSLPEGS